MTARREKNAETRSLARLLPDPAARGVGGWWRYPDVVVRMVPGADDDATVLGVRSLLAAGADLQVWGVDPDLLDGDPRVHAGEPPTAVLARCRTQVTLSGPVLWTRGGLAELLDGVRPGGAGRLTGRVGDVEVAVATTRALRRSARWGLPLAALFDEAEVAVPAEPLDEHPDLAHHLPRL